MADKEKVVATEKPEKPEKVKKEKKKGRVKEAWRGFKSETKKIVWPTWKQVLKNTFVVLIVVLVFVILIGILDYAFSHGIQALTELFTK
ncbi:MAG: preprotein translocase subunit SecE [Ruminococcaceae bacterium]|nr:preprotein translocase subunit SecE [Oscillospiraceae bacterium]